MITSTKLSVPLSMNHNIKLLEYLKQGYTGKISWNKYRCELTIHSKNNHLDYMIYPKFTNINRLPIVKSW